MSSLSSTKKSSTKTKISTGLVKSKPNLKVFGGFKRHLNPLDLDQTSTPVHSTNSSISELREKIVTPPTVIEEFIVDKGQNSSSSKELVNITRSLEDGLVYAIVLPFLKCENSVIQQPLLLKLRESTLIDYKFNLPFDCFNDRERNCFEFAIGVNKIKGCIMAIGDSPLKLKVSLQQNISSNSDWINLPKMIRVCSGITPFSHSPLPFFTDVDDLPFLELSVKDINDLLKKEVNLSDRQINKDKEDQFRDQEKDSTSSSSIDETPLNKIEEKVQENDVCLVEKKKERRSKIDKIHVDHSLFDVTIEKINKQINALLEKKAILSSFDTSGSILITIIDILDDLRTLNDLKKQNESDSFNHVSESDSTYKNSKKNKIFLEGLIELDLDLYETATTQAKPNNPGSLAYCLVKFSFPRNYIEDVTLGKKVYSKKEMEELIKKKSENTTEIKFPLSYIWGFQDPYNARMEGNFDSKLGLQRTKAFINHIFRKSKIFSYSSKAEKEVRNRIMKELCFRNSNLHDHDLGESNIAETITKEGQLENYKSSTWDLDCFE